MVSVFKRVTCERACVADLKQAPEDRLCWTTSPPRTATSSAMLLDTSGPQRRRWGLEISCE